MEEFKENQYLIINIPSSKKEKKKKKKKKSLSKACYTS